MNYYNEIKEQIMNNEITKRVKDYSKNKSDLNTYYNIGKLLSEAGKHYGEGIIKEYSKKLTEEFGKGYTISSLKRYRKFFFYIEKGATLSHLLNWSHYQEILPLSDIEEINYYINICSQQNLSVRQLREKLKNKEYERLPEETKNKLITNEQSEIKDLIKNPIIISNKYNYEKISEKMLKKLILEDLDNFLTELGDGFSYISNEYKIKLGNYFNYIDILLYNIKYNCYVVIELKITELKAEYIGQIQKYMNYIDKNIRTNYQDKTIGIIICKKDNHFVMEYCSDERIFRTTYILK